MFLEVKTIQQPTTEKVVRYQESSSSDTDYSLDLTAEEVLETAE